MNSMTCYSFAYWNKIIWCVNCSSGHLLTLRRESDEGENGKSWYLHNNVILKASHWNIVPLCCRPQLAAEATQTLLEMCCPNKSNQQCIMFTTSLHTWPSVLSHLLSFKCHGNISLLVLDLSKCLLVPKFSLLYEYKPIIDLARFFMPNVKRYLEIWNTYMYLTYVL